MEFVALLPLIAIVGAVLLQAVLAGQAFWLAGSAARSAARAEAVTGGARAGALQALPARLERGLRVRVGEEAVLVSVRIPSLLGVDLGAASASAFMESQS